MCEGENAFWTYDIWKYIRRMASRVSVYPPSDWLHSTLRVDSIPQTSCGFHPRLSAWFYELHFCTMSTIKDAVDDTIHCVFYLCKEEGTRRNKCNSPVDCCRRRLDGGEPLSAQNADANESLPAYQRRIIRTRFAGSDYFYTLMDSNHKIWLSGGHFFSPWESPWITGRNQ